MRKVFYMSYCNKITYIPISLLAYFKKLKCLEKTYF